jgi:hypothetical protein
MTAKTKPYVFISHASDDQWVARQIEAHVQRCGAKTFLDVSDIRYGADTDDSIIRALNDATEVAVLLTPQAVKRPYIWLELGPFWASGKPIIGFLYGLTTRSVSTSLRMPIVLKRIRLLPIDNADEYFRSLRERVLNAERQDEK